MKPDKNVFRCKNILMNISLIMNKACFLLIVSSAFFFVRETFAQEYHNIESNNIRIDPEWVVAYESGGTCWASDIIPIKMVICILQVPSKAI